MGGGGDVRFELNFRQNQYDQIHVSGVKVSRKADPGV